MTLRTCPSCQYDLDRTPGDARNCPACGESLMKQPADDFIRGGRDLRRVARIHRKLLWFVLILIAVQFAPFLLDAVTAIQPRVVLGLALLATSVVCQIAILVQIMRLMASMGDHIAVRILVGVLMFAPCVNLISLIIVSVRATRMLKAVGLKVGLLGVKDEDVVRVLSRYLCHTCGYSLIGNLSGRCPECGAVVEIPRDAARAE